MKNTLFKIIIRCCFIMATIAAGTASYWGGFQQKEPENMENIIKNRRK